MIKLALSWIKIHISLSIKKYTLLSKSRNTYIVPKYKKLLPEGCQVLLWRSRFLISEGSSLLWAFERLAQEEHLVATGNLLLLLPNTPLMLPSFHLSLWLWHTQALIQSFYEKSPQSSFPDTEYFTPSCRVSSSLCSWARAVQPCHSLICGLKLSSLGSPWELEM